MKAWIEPEPVPVSQELRQAVGGHLLLAETLARRGYGDPHAARAFLDPDAYTPTPAAALPDMARAAGRLEEAILRGESICVWGDFDVDGQTATAVLLSALRELGAIVSFHVPIRGDESHGLSMPRLRQLIGGGVSVILTCDTGVSDHEAIAFVKGQGADVIVTDHHELPQVLPPALAVLNPKLLPKDHPLRELPGVGVAYKLVEELYRRAGRQGQEVQYLDLVVLGLVADLSLQRGDVRYLIQRGLQWLRRSERPGLLALMEAAELDRSRLSEEHIAFGLAPRLNAAGRLADAHDAVELLTTRELTRARILASELEGLNARRQLLCDQVFQAAQAQIEADPSILEGVALVLSHPAWPVGVIGIVASRLAELYSRPAVLIATPEGELAHGSARSVEGCNITEAIAEHAALLASFGGHPMAAGFRLKVANVPAFRRGLVATVARMLGGVERQPTLAIDGYLPLEDLSLELVEDLERLAPFGPGNPPLTLATRHLTLKSHSTVGRSQEHLQLFVEDEQGTIRRVIWWQGAGWPLPEGRFDLAYAVRASDYRGQREVQIEWLDFRPSGEPAKAPVLGKVQVIDLRHHSQPEAILEALRRKDDILVWGEVQVPISCVDRYRLRPASALAIWTAPPGPQELRAALERVKPEKVYLFAQDPATDGPQAFLRRLAGLVRYALRRKQGRTTVGALAAATAQREETVRAGLAWLAARGSVQWLEEGEELRLSAGKARSRGELAQLGARLRSLLEETSAYREYYARAEEKNLVG